MDAATVRVEIDHLHLETLADNGVVSCAGVNSGGTLFVLDVTVTPEAQKVLREAIAQRKE